MRPYNVKMVADLLGVSPHTLRAWERRYSAIVPERTAKGRRMYAQTEVERLRLLVLLTQQGHHIGNVARLPDGELDSLLQKSQTLLNNAPLPKKNGEDVITATNNEAARKHIAYLLSALSEYRIGDVAQELEWTRLSLSARELVLKILSPLLFRVGEMVQEGKLSIAQEHALSSVIRDQIGQILHTLPHNRRPSLLREQESILFTTPEGERHEFGILLGAVLSAYHGIPFHYLGPSLPAESLIEAANALHAHTVVLGLTGLPEETLVLPLEAYVTKLSQGLASGTRIWIGGAAKLTRQAIAAEREVRMFCALSELDQVLAELARARNHTVLN